jgi:two-component system, OmpR family, alkaline phosphatase synthesis response regulator PhoP
MRVLVIDDDAAFSGMVRAALEEFGHAVVTATDGSNGLACLEHSPPDAIILDLRMPISDGRSFARAYARLPGPHAPIIVISGHLADADEPRIDSAVAYLSKPFELDHLLGVLDDLRQGSAVS